MTAADVAVFLADAKELTGAPMRWAARNRGTSDVALCLVGRRGLVIGGLTCVQVHAQPRNWAFKLALRGTIVIEWHYEPEGAIRAHHNRGPRPAGYDRKDRSVIHEQTRFHPEAPGRSLSKGLVGRESDTHLEAFGAFCDATYVDPHDLYRAPPKIQTAFAT